MVEKIGGVLIGAAVTRTVVPALPAALRSNNAMATATSVGVALLAGWAGGKVSTDFGNAVMLGGLAQAASVALNAFVPQVGKVIGLSGRRGTGDYVPAAFTVPQNPVLLTGPGITTFAGAPARRAYGPAYGG